MTAIIFDVESTGLVEPQIIEAAWVKLNDSTENGAERIEIVESFNQRYKPTKPISLGAMVVHGIMDEDLVSEPCHTTFSLPSGIKYLIGHNIDYDWKIAGSPDIKRICTLALSRSLWPNTDSHSLSAMLYLLERDTARDRLKNAHNALQDVLNCFVLLSHIVGKLGGVLLWEQLWEASEAARTPTVMPFGKWKGTPINEVPKDYVRWLLKQPDVDQYLIKAFETK